MHRPILCSMRGLREKKGVKKNGMRKSSKQERERARRKEEWGERARNRE